MKRSAFAKVNGRQGVSLDATLGDDSSNCKSTCKFKKHPIQVPQIFLGCLRIFNKTVVLLLIDLSSPVLFHGWLGLHLLLIRR